MLVCLTSTCYRPLTLSVGYTDEFLPIPVFLMQGNPWKKILGFLNKWRRSHEQKTARARVYCVKTYLLSSFVLHYVWRGPCQMIRIAWLGRQPDTGPPKGPFGGGAYILRRSMFEWGWVMKQYFLTWYRWVHSTFCLNEQPERLFRHLAWWGRLSSFILDLRALRRSVKSSRTTSKSQAFNLYISRKRLQSYTLIVVCYCSACSQKSRQICLSWSSRFVASFWWCLRKLWRLCPRRFILVLLDTPSSTAERLSQRQCSRKMSRWLLYTAICDWGQIVFRSG